MIVSYTILRIVQFWPINSGGELLEAINPLGIITNLLFLNGLIPNNIINNQIVYGGWFVGTIMIFYFLFPFLHRIFFNRDNKISKHKYLIPFVVELLLDIILLFLGKFDSHFLCSNNNFIYFSFVNQLSSFSIGILLYDIYINNKKIKCSQIKMIVAFIISIILFYGNFTISFLILPFVFSLFFVYLFISSYKMIENKKNIEKNFLYKFGNINWEIYLTHPIIAYFVFKFVNRMLSKFVLLDLFRYIILLPIYIICIYYVGNLFKILIKKINNCIKN
jgi:hypothetical protein